MKSIYRTKLSYYRQVYNFSYLITELAHPSWSVDIFVPPKIAQDPVKAASFRSSVLLQTVPPLAESGIQEVGLLFFLCSLPPLKFRRFIHYLVLSFLKNDKSILIHGQLLKKLSSIFSSVEMEFLLHEKSVKIISAKRFSLDKNSEIDELFILRLAYQLFQQLLLYFQQTGLSVLARLQLRFPKEIILTQQTFDLSVDYLQNIDSLRTLSDGLFSKLFETFEQEQSILLEAMQNLTASKVHLINAENAYKVKTLQEA